MDTPAQCGSRAAEFAQFPGNGIEQLRRIVRSAVGEFVVHLIPDAFVRVEFRGISREGLQEQARVLSQEGADGLSLVNAAIVPHDDDMFAQMT